MCAIIFIRLPYCVVFNGVFRRFPAVSCVFRSLGVFQVNSNQVKFILSRFGLYNRLTQTLNFFFRLFNLHNISQYENYIQQLTEKY